MAAVAAVERALWGFGAHGKILGGAASHTPWLPMALRAQHERVPWHCLPVASPPLFSRP